MCFDAPFIELLTGLCQKRLSFILIFWANYGAEQKLVKRDIIYTGQSVYVPIKVCVCVWVSEPHTLPSCQKALTWWQSEMASKRLSAPFPLRPVVPSSRTSTSNPRTPAPTIKRKLNDSLYCISPPTLQSENIKNKRQERACTPLAEFIEHSSYSFLSF